MLKSQQIEEKIAELQQRLTTLKAEDSTPAELDLSLSPQELIEREHSKAKTEIGRTEEIALIEGRLLPQLQAEIKKVKAEESKAKKRADSAYITLLDEIKTLNGLLAQTWEQYQKVLKLASESIGVFRDYFGRDIFQDNWTVRHANAYPALLLPETGIENELAEIAMRKSAVNAADKSALSAIEKEEQALFNRAKDNLLSKGTGFILTTKFEKDRYEESKQQRDQGTSA